MTHSNWSSALLVLALAISTSNAQFIYAGCDVSSAVIDLPPNQSILKVPSTTPNSIALGVGVQNYTCGPAGNYTSAGAVAEFYDISCLLQAKGGAFETVQDVVFDIWNGTDGGLEVLSSVDTFFKETWLLDVHLGTHVFQPSPTGSGISPVFDYRAASRKGDPDAFVLAAGNGTLPAPTGPQDVAWLNLNGVQGNLGKTVMRVNTVAGQPPASCEPGSGPISVKYAAKYWFFGGPQSPLVGEYGSIVSSAWIQVSGYASSGNPSSKSGSKNLAVDDVTADGNGNGKSLSVLDPKSPSFPIVIAMIVINGIFVVGSLVAIILYTRTRNSRQYVPMGSKTAPKGVLDDMEQELGPFDPRSSLPTLTKHQQ